jgi:Arc/MetJ-type ribon-helix-helix transcriptional regulator
MTQVVARIGDELLSQIDRLVREGVVPSRSEAVRLGLQALIDAHRRAEIGRRIVEGYERTPPESDMLAWAEAAGRAMIEAEPW